ncbi:unnamed protein product [Adineta ricciae]|uniref:Acyltransferase 3 domain-containing protein n=1 Tax=Adineta ricciae TaxID=249248 RepID=A0A814T8B3_ADIRI|nr:unnamed protein product [Adineta ricciae]CAF1411306.1 unnamed protein product [Adineta ricciae]
MVESRNIKYISSVDHIRAYAAILIVLYHGIELIHQLSSDKKNSQWPVSSKNPLKSFIIEGKTAVSLFMVLSGFIFTYGNNGEQIEYFRFLYNRILRIYPLMITMMMIGISVYPWRFSIEKLFGTLLPFQNINNSSLRLGEYTIVFWTIAVEFQFYLIFPYLNQFLYKKGLMRFSLMFVLTFIIRISAVVEGANSRDISYWTILGRLDQFMCGMVAAYLLKNFNIQNRMLVRLLPAGLIGIIISITIFHRMGGWNEIASWKIIWPIIEGSLWATFLIGYLTFFHQKDNIVLRFIANIGTISYSMYLIHHFVAFHIAKRSLVISLFKDLFLNAFFTSLILTLPLTMLISTLTYYLIEKPFLGMRKSYSSTNKETVRPVIRVF